MSPSQFLDPSNLLPGDVLAGIQADYEIDSKLGHGQRGNTYIAHVKTLKDIPTDIAFERVAEGQQVVIKTVNLSLEWPLVRVLQYLSGVNFSLQKELFVLANLKSVECAAQVYDYHHFSTLLGNFPVHPMFIVQEYIPGQTLNVFTTAKWGKHFAGIRESTEWFRLASLIATNIIAVHQTEVVHRDIWPPNIMIQETECNGSISTKLTFIDFGDAVLRHELAVRDSTLGHEHPYLAPERSNDWLWPTRRGDIYAVGGVLFYLATGKQPPHPIENDDELKQTVQDTIHDTNPTLLRQNQGVVDVIARCLRFDPSDRIRDADELLQEIEVFQDIDRNRVNIGPGLYTALEKIARQVEYFNSPNKDVMAAMALQDLRLLAHRLESMTHGVRDIAGDHNDIVSGLTRYLSLLSEGDEYLAISIPQFWWPENLGINGRFLTMNKLLAERGVKIRRLFLVTQSEWDEAKGIGLVGTPPKKSFAEIAVAHLRIQHQLNESSKIDLRVLVVPEDMRAEFRKNDHHQGAWISGSSAITILPVYNRHGRIRNVRMRSYQGEVSSLRKDMVPLIDRGEELRL